MDYAVTPMSHGHTFGNVSAFVTEYVKGWFPTNYFKTVNVSTTMAYRHFNIFDNTNREFIKKNKPMLIIRPRVDVMNDDVFMKGSLLTTRITDNFLDRDFGNLQPFIENPTAGIHVRYLMNRIKMYFDVTMIYESQLEQLNQAMFIKNRVRQDLPFVMETALENNIPYSIMEGLAYQAGKDINNTKEILDHVNSMSLYPITYKMKNSTGKDEFFRYYPVRMDTIITGLSLDDGSKKGFIDDAFAINFTIETEFPTAGLYYIFTKDPKVLMTASNGGGGNGDVASTIGDDGRVSMMFTVSKMFDIEPPPGWNLYTAPAYKVESAREPDVLDISTLFNNSLKAVLKYHVDNGIPLNKVVKVDVMKDNTALKPELGEYVIDFDKMTLTTNSVNKVSTYRLIIHVNTLYVNNLVEDIYELEHNK